MKTKKLYRKLVLSKQTVATLNKDELSFARGGEFTLGETRLCSCDCTAAGETCVTADTVCSCWLCP